MDSKMDSSDPPPPYYNPHGYSAEELAAQRAFVHEVMTAKPQEMAWEEAERRFLAVQPEGIRAGWKNRRMISAIKYDYKRGPGWSDHERKWHVEFMQAWEKAKELRKKEMTKGVTEAEKVQVYDPLALILARRDFAWESYWIGRDHGVPA